MEGRQHPAHDGAVSGSGQSGMKFLVQLHEGVGIVLLSFFLAVAGGDQVPLAQSQVLQLLELFICGVSGNQLHRFGLND